ncbi:Pyruvate/2-oxoglutarate dehydrogenase complex, dihydrolipoamide acyltransferase (E2) component [Methylomagnum ishizawai]|uniref:Dihydrolipoamide acetyltransferase component of pyruvate dehydrogenase complex n=1 Tax=Methylomagnum ishizawai TaxID=1760988 RepID=A0A1Y6D457_9GAMM|nr:biotin/lipoyl-containing protein [Methylomagnum ishizawai]SMF95623.1 Pyruvate/2-oxoglutarate dehydrogenase complex, dihydrolipoamide acyltransferase (E2) component [Methylomagnum ishizawai]
MAIPVYTPRVNNNDDEVRLIGLEVAVGDRVARGQAVAQIETDKAVMEIEAPAEGYVLDIAAAPDSQIAVGSILIWLGTTPDSAVPQAADLDAPPHATAATPTAKARQLLQRYGLTAAQVPAQGPRLTAAAVSSYAASQGLAPLADAPPPPRSAARAPEPMPGVPGQWRELQSDEKGMLATVTWHRDHAVPGYIELEYDPRPWAEYARTFAERHKLMLSPLLSLMAWRLTRLAAATPKLNSALIDERRYEYAAVNLGFTAQVDETLYLCVLRDAEQRDALAFVNALLDLQRRAAVHKLAADETRGATLGFSSMERWKVSRHIPVLPPLASLMVAHTADAQGRAVLGATYDHRVLNGFQVVSALRKLGKPPSDTP